MQILREAWQYWWVFAIVGAICWPGIKKMVRTGQKPFKEQQPLEKPEEEGVGEHEPGMEAALGALPVNQNE